MDGEYTISDALTAGADRVPYYLGRCRHTCQMPLRQHSS